MKYLIEKILLQIFILLLAQVLYSQSIIPKFQSYQFISSTNTTQISNPMQMGHFVGQYNAQNEKLMRQGGMTLPGPTPPSTNKSKELELTKQDLKEEKIKANEFYRERTLQAFQNTFQEFLQMNPDSFSITKAVYLSESVFYDHPFPYQDFEKSISKIASFVKQILKQEGLNEKNNIALNYAIQKLYRQDNTIHNNKTSSDYTIKKLKYDFDDYMGDKDWTKMFVTKILLTGSGQCHSLPLLYLCVAEQLHAKAYLSLAPNHSFIQFFDDKKRVYNFETTGGGLVSTAWLMQSDAISATAFKKKTYLDTLSSRKLYAQSLADLQMTYLMRNGYDNFSQLLSKKILSIDSTNINALMIENNFAFYKLKDLLKSANNPPREQWDKYPEIKEASDNLTKAEEKIKQTGYQDISAELYAEWLKSIETEKQKQRYKEQQEQMQSEVKKQRKLKSTFTNSSKG